MCIIIKLTDISLPSSFSSMTIVFPASPKALFYDKNTTQTVGTWHCVGIDDNKLTARKNFLGSCNLVLLTQVVFDKEIEISQV